MLDISYESPCVVSVEETSINYWVSDDAMHNLKGSLHVTVFVVAIFGKTPKWNEINRGQIRLSFPLFT